MTISITHPFVSGIADGRATAGAGAAEEIALSHGLALDAGGLRQTLAARRTTTVSITNTETQVLGLMLPANTLQVGSIIRIDAWGLETNTASASTSSLKLRMGSASLSGTIVGRADHVMGTSARTNIPFRIEAALTVLSTGATGTALGVCAASLSGDSAFTGAVSNVVSAAQTIDTTADRVVELTAISGASSTTWNVLGASLEVFL